MTEGGRAEVDVSAQQELIRAKAVHPSGSFIEFKKEEIEQSMSDRFEKQVRLYPNRTAVRALGQHVTYDAFNRNANRVARVVLGQLGEGEEPVALMIEQGTSIVSAMIAVWKAGKFCVNLDPSSPPERTKQILEDSQARMVVTDEKHHLMTEGPVGAGLTLLNVDRVSPGLSSENLNLSVSPGAIAFLAYTSGSTGQPKGVILTHRHQLHGARRNINTFHICPEDRLTLLYAGTVGTFLGDLSYALLNGATACMLNVAKQGLSALGAWLNSERISIYHSPATLFRQLATSLTGKEEFPDLRVLLVGSEPLYRKDVELYRKHFSQDCILVHSMGASETESMASYYIDKETQISGSTVPVGYPVEDTKFLLLDDHGSEVDTNEIGQIGVKSRYLFTGYWRRPELTAAAFLPNSSGSDERIFLTGDLGRLDADGCLIHLGRMDFRVKVRGYRVETAEVEGALLGLKAIKEAVVVAKKEDRAGEQHLVAYLVPAEAPALTVSAVRRALSECLPSYMVPSAFVVLDALPRTPNGKVDRSVLPAPGRGRPELEGAFVAPSTATEEVLALIWAETLGLDRLGVHDNFLELGGHSLLAAQLVSRVLKAFRVELPLGSLLEAPTVADMAEVIDRRRSGEK